MAIAVRGWISAAASGSGSDLTVSATTGWNTAAPQAGDLLVAFVQSGGVGDLTAGPAGWTRRLASQLTEWGLACETWTTAFNVSDTSYTWTAASSGSQREVIVVALSGASTTTVYDGTPAATDYDFGSTANPMLAPSITGLTASDGHLLTFFGITKNTSAGTFSTPSGMTSIGSQQNTATAIKDTIHAFGLALASSGATGTKSSTVSPSYLAGAAHSLVIKAASSATNVDIGLQTETDTLLGLTAAHAPTLGIQAETDALLGLTVAHTPALGPQSTTEQLLPLQAVRVVELGDLTGTDAVLAATALHTPALGILDEADDALPVAVARVAALGLLTEGDDLLPAAAAHRPALGLLLEADSITAVEVRHLLAVGLLSETDTLLGLQYDTHPARSNVTVRPGSGTRVTVRGATGSRITT